MDPHRLVALLILFVLPLTALITVGVTAIALTARAVRTVRAGVSGHWPCLLVPGAFGQVSAMLSGTAVLAYYYGSFSIPWFDIDDYCAHESTYTSTHQPFRLSATCTDGVVTVQYVPGWVNPATVVLVALAVAAAVAAVAAAVRRRRRTLDGHQASSSAANRRHLGRNA